MLSRRNALLGTSLAVLYRTEVAAQRSGEDAEVIVLAPDAQPTSIKLANGIVARLGAADSRIHAEVSHGVGDAMARLGDRSRPIAAIVPSTALAYMEQSGSPSREAHANRYIAQLETLTFQTLASQRISNFRQLAGLKVNLGPPGSPSQVTASVLLDQFSVRIDPLYLDHETASAAVIRGELAAMMILAPKAAPVFFDVASSDPVHFLPVSEPRGGRLAGFTAAQILPTDYPMVPGTGRVNTVALPLLLACFGWAAETPNFTALARLADLLARRGSGLPGFDMAASIAGWQRFAPVEDWLAGDRSASIQDFAAADTRPPVSRTKPTPPDRPASATRETEQHAAQSRPDQSRPDQSRRDQSRRDQSRSAAQSGPEQKEKLFQEFLNWRRRR